MNPKLHPYAWGATVVLIAVLAVGTWRDDDFWSTADQRGDSLMAKRRFAEAAATYEDPMKSGTAFYRAGEFEKAVKAFARVPGRDGFFNSGNAFLMHGDYDRAIERYDRALDTTPGWKPAQENQDLAKARRDAISDSGKNRDQESTEAYNPDDVVTDNKGGDNKDASKKPIEGAEDASLQATWLRNVKTTPGQFLKAKFAWQAQNQEPPR